MKKIFLLTIMGVCVFLIAGCTIEYSKNNDKPLINNSLPTNNEITRPIVEIIKPIQSEEKKDFMSDKKCADSIKDCSGDIYTTCFEGYCVKVNGQLKEYIYNNYEHTAEGCSKPCEGCKSGALVSAGIGQNISYCIECKGHVFTCKEGYECNEAYKCVKK